MAAKKGGLGRGLESLFDENSIDNNMAVTLNINDVEPNRNQPRKNFDPDSLSQLAESISQHGLIQPIIVHPNLSGSYTIVAGERRWRACKQAGLTQIPAIIKEADDKTLTEFALIENLQREDLNPFEEAEGYKFLIDNFDLTQEEVANRMAKSRSAVTNALRLLNLKPDEAEALKNGTISAGHARALLSCADDEKREKLFNMALSGASVRELEKAAKVSSKTGGRKTAAKMSKFYSEVELSLKNEIGRKVIIKPGKNGRGTLTIEFYSDEELKKIAEKLSED